MFIKRCVAFIFFFSVFLTPTVSNVLGSYPTNQIKPSLWISPPESPPEVAQPMAEQPNFKVVKGIVNTGDTPFSLLNKYLPMQTIYRLNRQSAQYLSSYHFKKGQSYKFILQEDNLIGFEYEINKQVKLVIQREKIGFSIMQMPMEYDRNLAVVSATITTSLVEAVGKSGEPHELAWKLSDIFAWDIDFSKDIQPGDRFDVLIEKRYLDGQFMEYGKIQAAIFTHNGTCFKAFLHKDSKGVSGYYDENGTSLQKSFLRVPLEFSRISSNFTPKRMHPILKEYRSHPGVDYAAPMGTPIKTVGDGVITEFGYSKTMGNNVTVRHFNGYITQYYHMSKFAKGMKKNSKVIQGEVIGHVGMTGYATGPHLCFRMIKDGKPVNPLTHKSPSAAPVTPGELEQFQARTKKLSQKILTAHTPQAPHKKSA